MRPLVSSLNGTFRKVACIKRNLLAHTAELLAAYGEPVMILKIQAGCCDCLNYVQTLTRHTHFIQLQVRLMEWSRTGHLLVIVSLLADSLSISENLLNICV